ncbi:MAG: DUF1624 domain-containing protein [Gemmatimonadales bacterium]
MTTAVRPESDSGAFPIRRTSAVPRPHPAPAPRRPEHVDLLRGLVMVIMVLDHVRGFLTNVTFDPTDMARTDLALFGTRWITHFCAPVFVFLAGASAWIAGTRRTRGELTRLLLTRGAWLVLLEFTVISFGWYFSFHWNLGARAQVIWAIGASMIALAGLTRLPRPAVAGVGLLLVAGHNLLDGISPESLGRWAPLWMVLHVRGQLGVVPVQLIYPVLPWIGVMALGYAAGPAIFSPDPVTSRRVAWVGVALIAGFAVLRGLNGYGDLLPRLENGGTAIMAMSFLNTTKYPPSLDYVLMTLGPALVALHAFRGAGGPLARVMVTFGRVPFLFYVTHLYLVHAVAVAAGVGQGYPVSSMLVMHGYSPAGFGFGLPVIYLVWLAVVVALYPLCRRYAELKGRSRAWWLSYL